MRNARHHGPVVVALACALAGLAGCTGDAPDDCQPGGTALVTATGPDGRTWQRTTDVTVEPPSVDGGYVLVRHPCSWTALDLEDGSVVREGDERAVGVAGAWVYTLDDDDESVSGEAVEAGTVDHDTVSWTLHTPGQQQQAYAVDEHLYTLPRQDGPVSLTQYATGGVERWTASLPVVREPTLTPVGDVLVVTSADGSVYGVDLGTGDVRWRALVDPLADTYGMSVRRRDDQAVVTARPDSADPVSVVVLDAATGERLDRSARPAPEEQGLTGTSDGWSVVVEAEPMWVIEE